MQVLNVSKAKSGFSRMVRSVIKTRQPVVVKAPSGFVQICPWDLPEEVPPARQGSLKLTEEEIKIHNTFGETL